MELVRQGYFAAFIDLVPGAYSEYLLGGNRASRADRLDIAADRPIPYIFCPGGFDMISCGPLERRDKDDLLWTLEEPRSRGSSTYRTPCESRPGQASTKWSSWEGLWRKDSTSTREKARVKVHPPLGGASRA